MNETMLTMMGNVATDPTRRVLDKGGVKTEFRLASSPRWVDRATGTWTDGETSFVTVVSWRALADHVALSLHKGDPVVVHGRLSVPTWENDGVKRSTVEITATAVGHDLSRGTSSFTASRRGAPTVAEEAESEPRVTDESPGSEQRAA